MDNTLRDEIERWSKTGSGPLRVPGRACWDTIPIRASLNKLGLTCPLLAPGALTKVMFGAGEGHWGKEWGLRESFGSLLRRQESCHATPDRVVESIYQHAVVIFQEGYSQSIRQKKPRYVSGKVRQHLIRFLLFFCDLQKSFNFCCLTSYFKFIINAPLARAVYYHKLHLKLSKSIKWSSWQPETQLLAQNCRLSIPYGSLP